jgi:hypothetical protein
MARTARLLTAFCAAAALTACGEPTRDPQRAVPDPSGPVATATGATPTPTGATIPEAALLQPDDLGGAQRLAPTGQQDEYLRPPRPCGKAGPSDAQRLAATRAHYAVTAPDLTGRRVPVAGLFELVMVFRPGGADAYRAEVLDEVRRCPTAGGDHRWSLDSGADVLRLTVDRPVRYADTPGRQRVPVLVALTGDVVVVLADTGYETGDGDPALLSSLVDRALQRARSAG